MNAQCNSKWYACSPAVLMAMIGLMTAVGGSYLYASRTAKEMKEEIRQEVRPQLDRLSAKVDEIRRILNQSIGVEKERERKSTGGGK